MRRMPPKTTSAVSTARSAPTTQATQVPAFSLPMVDDTVALIVLACSELKASGKQRIRITAKTMPIQRARSPFCM